jgi:protein TonB
VERPADIAPRKPVAAVTATEDAPAPAPARPSHAGTSSATASAPRKALAAQAAAISEADEVLFQSFRSNSVEAKAQKPSKKKWTMIAVAGGAPALLLLLLTLPVFKHGKTAPVSEPVSVPQQPVVTTEDEPDSVAVKPSPSSAMTPPAQDKRAAASDNQDAADSKAAATDSTDTPPAPVQSEMMNDQLNAPTRIQHTKTDVAADAPPPAGFGIAGMDGNAGVGNVLNGQKPRVQVATPSIVRVSAGVAVGLLVRKTTPVYPMIAKTARVSGTVVLSASITKTGAIENLRVVSGPSMLRQSALDAVRTWRYKPYQLNNEPTEIETTINVIFSLVG